jgi:hypothetical protein
MKPVQSKPAPIMILDASSTVSMDEEDKWKSSKDVEMSYGDYPTPPDTANFYPTPPNDDHYFDVIPPSEYVSRDIV